MLQQVARILLALLLFAPALAENTFTGARIDGALYGSSVFVAGGACSSPSAIITVSGGGFADGAYGFVGTTGQSFSHNATVVLHSISVYIYQLSGASDGLELRLDDDLDLTADTLATATLTATTTGTQQFVFTPGSRPTISASTTYYFAIDCAGCGANGLLLSQGSNTYANGTILSRSGGTDYVMTTGSTDLDFVVSACP